jgi:hypothetical protein
MLKYCDRDFYNHLKEKMDAYKSQNKDEWELQRNTAITLAVFPKQRLE